MLWITQLVLIEMYNTTWKVIYFMKTSLYAMCKQQANFWYWVSLIWGAKQEAGYLCCKTRFIRNQSPGWHDHQKFSMPFKEQLTVSQMVLKAAMTRSTLCSIQQFKYMTLSYIVHLDQSLILLVLILIYLVSGDTHFTSSPQRHVP